jgi:type III secretion protein D
MNASVLRLRVFSGPHRGAEISLPAGEFLVGSDDSCDIILTDHSLSPRHVLVRIATAANDTPPEVRVSPVDGPVILQDQPAAAETVWAALTPCLLGSTMLAWIAHDQPAETWQKLVPTSPMHHQTASAVPETSVPESEAPPGAAPETPEPTDPEATTATSVPSARRSGPLGKVLRLAVIALCLGALGISYGYRPQSAEQTPADIAAVLAANGFGSLTVDSLGQIPSISGVVDDDEARGRLLRLARSLKTPMHLNVRVRSDKTNAIIFAFNTRGLFPEVREQEKDSRRVYLVSGYMRDQIVEDEGFRAVEEDLALEASVMDRRVLHADQVAEVLAPLLTKAGLQETHIQYLPGLVQVGGDFAGNRRETLGTILAEAQQHLEIPIRFRIVSGDASTTPPSAGRTASATIPPPGQDRADVANPLAARTDQAPPNLKVTGVTLTPMPFICLDTGERVFEGGQLASGHVLESIDSKKLKLRKNGQTTIYPLRGADE